MKLAELLMQRADLQKKIASLKTRAVASALADEGSKPIEEPDKLIAEAMDAMATLRNAITRINEINLQWKMPDGRVIMHWIAERDSLTQQHGLLSAVIEGSSQRSRYGRAEIKREPTVDVSALHTRLDQISARIRKVNLALQEQNWKRRES
jgi:hypothetical protein